MPTQRVLSYEAIRWTQLSGQVGDASTEATLYTCPHDKCSWDAVVYVTNRANAARTYRIRHRIAGAANDDKQWLAYDTSLGANGNTHTFELVIGPDDILTVVASDADVTFQVNGTLMPVDPK